MHNVPLIYFRSTTRAGREQPRARHVDGRHERAVASPTRVLPGPSSSARLHLPRRRQRQRQPHLQHATHRAARGRGCSARRSPTAGRSATPTRSARSRAPTAAFHLVWVWRDSPDASTNHDISLRRSRKISRVGVGGNGTAVTLAHHALDAERHRRRRAVERRHDQQQHQGRLRLRSGDRSSRYHKFDATGTRSSTTRASKAGAGSCTRRPIGPTAGTSAARARSCSRSSSTACAFARTARWCRTSTTPQYGGRGTLRLDETDAPRRRDAAARDAVPARARHAAVDDRGHGRPLGQRRRRRHAMRPFATCCAGRRSRRIRTCRAPRSRRRRACESTAFAEPRGMPRRLRAPHGGRRVVRTPRGPAGSAAAARDRAPQRFGETAVVTELVGGSERRDPGIRVARIGGEDERGLLERETSVGQLERTPGERARSEREAHGERAGLGRSPARSASSSACVCERSLVTPSFESARLARASRAASLWVMAASKCASSASRDSGNSATSASSNVHASSGL